MKRSGAMSLWLLALALNANIASGQSSPDDSLSASIKHSATTLGASAWMAVPTPFSDRNKDGLLESLRSERDRLWDDAISAPTGTFEVTVYDIVTDKDSKLGYHFSGTVPRNWVEIALHKRESILNERRRIQ